MNAHTRTLASILAVLLFANTFIAVRTVVTPAAAKPVADATFDGTGEGLVGLPPAEKAKARAASVAKAARTKKLNEVRDGKAGAFIPGKGTIPHGLKGNKIKLVYYWKGDQTMSSQFLHQSGQKTGQEGNVDEGLAFLNLIKYINKYKDGGSLMGYDFDLHGWEFDPQVIVAGKGDEQLAAARTISGKIKPFAAVSSHGSVSAYVCPLLAKNNIFNISTYDLDFGLTERTNGMCLPQGLSFGAQADLTVSYLKKHRSKPYMTGAVAQPRKYGLLYAEYPGLVDSGPKIERMLKAAGVPIVATKTVDPDTATAARQQPTVIADFVQAGVNTIIAPDSGSLLTFTHAAQGAGYTPDYYVWPCSGADSTGMVRLYDPHQWTRASGLTCYDAHLNADLTNDGLARQTEWYKAYQEMAGPNDEPPAPTALVYQSLLPLLVGITHAGRDLTIERFKEGLKTVKPYRYDAITGKTTNPENLLVVTDAADGSQVGDSAKIVWNATFKQSADSTPGAYTFPENRRYRRGQAF